MIFFALPGDPHQGLSKPINFTASFKTSASPSRSLEKSRPCENSQLSLTVVVGHPGLQNHRACWILAFQLKPVLLNHTALADLQVSYACGCAAARFHVQSLRFAMFGLIPDHDQPSLLYPMGRSLANTCCHNYSTDKYY
jgi:hypothetical protein